MSNPRVYGTFLDADGIRHEISGVVDGLFSKSAGGWDSYTTCGKYTSDEPDTNPTHYPTCLRCITRVRKLTLRNEDGSIRGETYDAVVIDEAQELDIQKFLTRVRGGTR